MTFLSSIACLVTFLPNPPYITFENSNLQLYPVEPDKCPNVDLSRYITFTLYTRFNPLTGQTLRVGDDRALANSYIDFGIPTMMYFHAFFEDADTVSATLIRQAYNLRGDHNIIMVSARQLVAGPWYPTSARNTRVIGLYAARFISYLYSRGLNPKALHLIGHSLGAQCAGVAGGSLGPNRPARITGLDPALPLFAKIPNNLRLDRGDADYVDIIHTDAGIFGIVAPMGHADFYPNSGKSPQPGCELEVVLPKGQLFEKFFCSHWRSFQFYAQSVLRPDAFPAVPCIATSKGVCDLPDYSKSGIAAYMGFGASPAMQGRFYVKTSSDPPYSVT